MNALPCGKKNRKVFLNDSLCFATIKFFLVVNEIFTFLRMDFFFFFLLLVYHVFLPFFSSFTTALRATN